MDEAGKNRVVDGFANEDSRDAGIVWLADNWNSYVIFVIFLAKHHEKNRLVYI